MSTQWEMKKYIEAEIMERYMLWKIGRNQIHNRQLDENLLRKTFDMVWDPYPNSHCDKKKCTHYSNIKF